MKKIITTTFTFIKPTVLIIPLGTCSEPCSESNAIELSCLDVEEITKLSMQNKSNDYDKIYFH